MDCGAVALAICLSLPDLGPPLENYQFLYPPVRGWAMQYRERGTIWNTQNGNEKPQFGYGRTHCEHDCCRPDNGITLALGNTKHYPRLFRREKTAFLVVEGERWTFLATPRTVSLVRRWELQ